MRKQYFLLILACLAINSWAADWSGIAVPADPGEGMMWQNQPHISDDFNYDAPADNKGADFEERWTEGYHNAWTGPAPTVWRDDHVSVSDGNLRIRASQDGQTITYESGGASYTSNKTYLGCITNKTRVVYPVYIETSVKIMKSVLASDVWLLSPDDTQEIDICEAYGGDREMDNEWFGNKRLHLSHHVFIRNPFQDWQPSDEGSFYTDGRTRWRDSYHRIGVYWKGPWELEYYVDGELVRTRNGRAEIDPSYFTQGEGLTKEMDIIINTEDQTWRAARGFTPTTAELANEANNTFLVDWVRVYKPVAYNGVDDTEKNSVKVYPNPAQDYITVKGDDSRIYKSVNIYNMLGSVVYTSPFAGSDLDISQLENGIYMVELAGENEKVVQRIAIRR